MNERTVYTPYCKGIHVKMATFHSDTTEIDSNSVLEVFMHRKEGITFVNEYSQHSI